MVATSAISAPFLVPEVHHLVSADQTGEQPHTSGLKGCCLFGLSVSTASPVIAAACHRLASTPMEASLRKVTSYLQAGRGNGHASPLLQSSLHGP